MIVTRVCGFTKGWSFLHAFLSSLSLPTAMPDMTLLVQYSGRQGAVNVMFKCALLC